MISSRFTSMKSWSTKSYIWIVVKAMPCGCSIRHSQRDRSELDNRCRRVRLGGARRSRKGLLPDVARTTTTSHARDRVFESGPLVGVAGLGETLPQVGRVVQAFLEPVRQLVDSVDCAVAHQ